MKKSEFIEYWQGVEEGQELRPAAVAYKHEGSTYAEDGIRITGSKEWIEQVLSHLKALLEFEGLVTRLQVNYQEAKDKETGLPLGSYCCYVQVHERGGEAKMINTFAGVPLSRGY